MPQITIGKGLAFYEEAQALPGVKRVAGMVKQDIELVTGVSPAGITFGQGSGCAVLYGTIGHSPMLDALEAAGKLDLNAIRGKWECYSFQVIETPLAGIGAALVIARAIVVSVSASTSPSAVASLSAVETEGVEA